MLLDEDLDGKIVRRLGLLDTEEPNMDGWRKMIETLKTPERELSIGIVGKYVDLKESYKSLHEAIIHGGIANNAKVNVAYIDSETLTDKIVAEALKNVDGILVPGGFGERGAEGKISAFVTLAENRVPVFGICFGMLMAASEFARNACGIKDATSREFLRAKTACTICVIDIMEEQKNVRDMGGTMRLGAYPCRIAKGTRTFEATVRP